MEKLHCILDLFCGAGGFSLGLSRNNIEIVLANEIEKVLLQKLLNLIIQNKDIK